MDETRREPSLSQVTIWVPTVLAGIAFSVGYGILQNRVEDNRDDIMQLERNVTELSNSIVLLQVAKAESVMELRSLSAMLVRIEAQQADIMRELRETLRVRSPDPYDGGEKL